MSDALERILAYKRREVEERMAAFGADFTRDALIAPTARGFRNALLRHAQDGAPALIAEVKRASPSKGVIREDFDPAVIAQAYARGGAACLSVLTDGPSFQGAEAHLKVARAACALPILRKDFMIDPWQVTESRAIGADAILVILAAIDDGLASELILEAKRFGMDVLVETHDEAELERAARLGADLIGVNNRDLKTFQTSLATTERLAELAPSEALLVSESGIATPADIARLQQAGAASFLVGESLMRQPDVEAATRALLEVS